MATTKNMSRGSYCSFVDKELSGLERRVDTLRENIKKEYSSEYDVWRTSEQQLIELADDISYKRQLLIKDCPKSIGSRDDLERPWVFPFGTAI